MHTIITTSDALPETISTRAISTRAISSGAASSGAVITAYNEPVKGRGALSNPKGRFSVTHSEADIVDSNEPDYIDDLLIQTPTSKILSQAQRESAKTIISRNKSPDVPFNQSINPYRGCEHGCVYCFARPTHAYLDLSPGLDFETRLTYKDNAAEVLEKTLTSPRYRCQPIVLGTNTDPYQPIEKEKQITRQLLEVLERHNHPFSIITKSSLILRDLSLLKNASKKQLCSVRISVTTLDNELKRQLEPRTASPTARLKTIKTLNDAGIPVGALIAPVIPKINDHELEAILCACAKAGAGHAAYIFIRLPHEVKSLFREWLMVHYPRRAEHVLSLIKQSGNGQEYDSRYGHRMTGTGPIADIIHQRFQQGCLKHGLNASESGKLNSSLFGAPNMLSQLSLF